jgi:hypothetical protein
MTITSLPRPALIAIVGGVSCIALFALTRRNTDTPATSVSVPSAGSPSAGSPQAGQPATGTPGGNPSAPVGGTVRPEQALRERNAPAPTTGDKSKSGRSGAQGQDSSSSTKLPAPVKRALARNKVVVLLFWNPVGTDDRSVKRALNGLSRRGGKVAVFSDRLKHVSRYTQITAATNLSQTPTLVVVNPRGQARVETGYLDRASVQQLVVDALRGA